MTKYPAVDSHFFEWGVAHGLSEEEINEDWRSYCEGLERFHEEVSVVMGEPAPVPSICVGGSQ